MAIVRNEVIMPIIINERYSWNSKKFEYFAKKMIKMPLSKSRGNSKVL